MPLVDLKSAVKSTVAVEDQLLIVGATRTAHSETKAFGPISFLASWPRPRCVSVESEIIIMSPLAPGHSAGHTPLLLMTDNQPEDYVDTRCTLA